MSNRRTITRGITLADKIKIIMADSDSDDEYLKSKKPKGVRGRRGLKKKSSSLQTETEVPETSHVYSTKASKCFQHLVSNDYDEELQHAKQETIESDVEDDLLTMCQENGSSRSTKLHVLSGVVSLSDDESVKDYQTTPSKSTTVTTVLSPSPPPPPSPPSSAGKSKGKRRGNRAIRGKKKLLKSVSNLTKDICSARRLLNENAALQTSFTSPDGEVCVIEPDDEVTVRVQFQGEIRRFGMNTDQPFSVVMEEFSRTQDVDFHHVMLVHKDKILRPTDTPASIKLHTADIIMCHINENLNNSLTNTPEVEDSSLIELCVQSRTSRHREIIKVHPQQPLRVLMEEYSRRVGTTLSSLQFWCDGEIISPTETAEGLDMADGECVDVNYLTEIVID